MCIVRMSVSEVVRVFFLHRTCHLSSTASPNHTTKSLFYHGIDGPPLAPPDTTTECSAVEATVKHALHVRSGHTQTRDMS